MRNLLGVFGLAILFAVPRASGGEPDARLDGPSWIKERRLAFVIGRIQARSELIGKTVPKDKTEEAKLLHTLEAADKKLAALISDADADKLVSAKKEQAAAARAAAAEAAASKVSAVQKTDAQKAAAARPAPPIPAPKPNACGTLSCRAFETAAKGSLGALRASTSIFYGDTEGNYPATLDALVPKHVEAIPSIEVGGHAKTNKVSVITEAFGKSGEAYVRDTGGWLYFATPDNPDLNGTVLIDCNHKGYYKDLPMSGF